MEENEDNILCPDKPLPLPPSVNPENSPGRRVTEGATNFSEISENCPEMEPKSADHFGEKLDRDSAEEKNEETIRQVESTEIQNSEKGKILEYKIL